MESGLYFRTDRVGEERWSWETPSFWAAAGLTSDTGTSLRVAGVDEADRIKTDGERIYLLTLDRLVVLTTQAHEPPSIVAELELSQRSYRRDDGTQQIGARGELLIHGDRALLVRHFAGGSLEYYGPLTELVEVDLADPYRLRVIRIAEFAGSVPVRSRLVDSQARLVLHYLHQPPLSLPSDAQARGSIRSLNGIVETELADWHPFYRLTQFRPQIDTTTHLVDCDATYLPTKLPFVPYRAAEVPYVVAIDLSVGLAGMKTALLLINADMPHTDSWAYVTRDSVYLASNVEYMSAIHKVDFQAGMRPRYVGSIEIENSIEYEQSLHELSGTLWVVASGDTYGRNAHLHTFRLYDLQDEEQLNRSLDGFGSEAGRMSLGEERVVVRFAGRNALVFRFPRQEPGNLWLLNLTSLSGSVEEMPADLENIGHEWFMIPVEGESLLALNGQREVGYAENVQPMLFGDETINGYAEVGVSGWDGLGRFRHVLWQDGVAWLVGSREIVGFRVTKHDVHVEARLVIDAAAPRYPISERRVVIAGGQIHAWWYDEGYKMYTWSLDNFEYLGMVDLGQGGW